MDGSASQRARYAESDCMAWRHYEFLWMGRDSPPNALSAHAINYIFVGSRTYVILISVMMKDKQRVLMHRHQGLNVRHGLCHIYMRYFIWVVYSFCLFCCLFIIVTWWYICGVLCGKWQARESTGMFGNLMAIYYIMPQFIQNHSRFVMLMKTCMIS